MIDVLVPIISSLFTLLGVVLTTRSTHDKTISEVQKQLDLATQEFRMTKESIQKDINALEKKQDQHNNLIARMYGVEQSVNLLDERMKVCNHRLEDLEKQAAV